jgi:hypothetical protein
MEAIFACTFERWQPGIGDAGWRGWSTVALYLAVAALAVLVARRAPFPGRSRGRERLFWGVVAGLMLALAVNKQLDLQSALTAAGRCMAKAQGWYGARRVVQALFLTGLATGGVLVLIGLLRVLRGTWARSALPALGLVFVLTFVLMRAVGFHHLDRILGMRGGIPALGVTGNMLFEWTGPLLVGGTALWLLGRRSRT